MEKILLDENQNPINPDRKFSCTIDSKGREVRTGFEVLKNIPKNSNFTKWCFAKINELFFLMRSKMPKKNLQKENPEYPSFNNWFITLIQSNAFNYFINILNFIRIRILPYISKLNLSKNLLIENVQNQIVQQAKFQNIYYYLFHCFCCWRKTISVSIFPTERTPIFSQFCKMFLS